MGVHNESPIMHSLPSPALLRHRIRYFTQGAVIGSKQFVEKHVAEWTDRMGDRRIRVPKAMNGEALNGPTSFRNLRRL